MRAVDSHVRILSGTESGMTLFDEAGGELLFSSTIPDVHVALAEIHDCIENNEVMAEYVTEVESVIEAAIDAIEIPDDQETLFEMLIDKTIIMLAENAKLRGVEPVEIWSELPDRWRTPDSNADNFSEIIEADMYTFLSLYLEDITESMITVRNAA